MSARMLLNQALRVLGRRRDLGAAIAAAPVVAPEVEEPQPPLVFLPGMLDRATAAVPGFAPLSHERATARAAKVVHAEVRRLDLHDALVHPAGVDLWGAALRHRPLGRGDLRGPVVRLDRAVFCRSSVATRYFGHWLLDACSTAMLAEAGEATIIDVNPAWPHAAAYAAAFGITPTPAPLARVGRLSLWQDHALGPHKRARLAVMRDRLAAAFGTPDPAGRRILLRRPGGGATRQIANEAALEARLAQRGFTPCDPGALDAPALWRRLAGAATVVSLEGSHMNHLVLALPPGARVLALIPGDRFTLIQAGYAQAARLRFGFVVLDPGAAGYRADCDAVERTLDLLEA
ncbi:MAG: glycosyltransferase 61 family protein [Gemmobacter sp.]